MSLLTDADLKRLVTGQSSPVAGLLRVFVTSFACRRGLPRGADRISYVGFPQDPYHVERSRGLTGCNRTVAVHIESDCDFTRFFARLWRLLELLLPRHEISGKIYSTIAIGRTGGRHRWIYAAQRLAVQVSEAGQQAKIAYCDPAARRAAGATTRRAALAATN